MALHRLALPTLTTTSLPPNVVHTSSSSTSNSPLTPFSELSSAITSSSTASISPKTPGFVIDSCPAAPAAPAKLSKNYITYPEPSFPPRQLTPPPKSRFAPLFESFSKDAASSPNLSRRGSLGDDEASPSVASITLPFSAAVAEQVTRLSPSFLSVDPAFKSAFLAGANAGSTGVGVVGLGHWPSRSESSPITSESRDQVNEKLTNAVKTLRHQMNLKNHRIHLAESEITRLSTTCNTLLDEKAKLAENYTHARRRIEELEHLLYTSNNERPGRPNVNPRLPSEPRGASRWANFHSRHSSNPDQKPASWQEPTKRQSFAAPRVEVDGDRSAVEDVSGDASGPVEPISAETYHAVLTRIPEMPTEVIMASVDKLFLSPEFDFIQWLETNGLELPQSTKKLAGMSWEDRLRLDERALKSIGVASAKDRSYIMRVLKTIAEGEYPHLHESLLEEPFTEDQYVTIMREQRIDKHVPNLSGIPWPLRLFVDEEDLTLIQVQKAGARGTIMTVFGGLRKGGARPDPRPRRGTKKSKRAKMEAAATAASTANTEESSYPENGSHAHAHTHARTSSDRKGSNMKVVTGHQGPRPREKGAFAPAHNHSHSSNSGSWYGHRV
ncbi:hypothetical protein M408DRAFT_274267 [Serendipita vermifera MAFF 305830]|uniref:SAM domain-containing protein n=1 Tax=Serendipita vermifera MAFF 305830 TaxID=933852 RepID=A0A0C3BHQ8_SERVB|nr:hypothetical protein M408DRAFT_274267 [Serendipita vermifera MAFF 305830]